MVPPTVDPDTVDDGCQGGGAEMSRARGHGVAGQTHHADVHRGLPRGACDGALAELRQDVLSVFQAVVLPAAETQTGSEDGQDGGR